VRKLCCEFYGLLYRFVKTLAETAIDSGIETNFMNEFGPRFVVEPNCIHL